MKSSVKYRDNNELKFPAQVAAVCYRRKETQLEFLLLNTSSGRWTFPKGDKDLCMTESAAAALEALEEAGACGTIASFPFTSYVHSSGGREYPVRAFLLEVLHICAPKELFRAPTWFPLEMAKLKLSEGRDREHALELHRVLHAAAVLIASDFEAADAALGINSSVGN